MKADKLFVVYKPTLESDKGDIFNGEPTTLENLYNQFNGGLKPDMIHAIYTKKAEAEKEADMLYKKLLRERDEDDPFSYPTKERFSQFISAFEKISTRYGVVVRSTGGVTILNRPTKIEYDDDHTSGDIRAFL